MEVRLILWNRAHFCIFTCEYFVLVNRIDAILDASMDVCVPDARTSDFALPPVEIYAEAVIHQ